MSYFLVCITKLCASYCKFEKGHKRTIREPQEPCLFTLCISSSFQKAEKIVHWYFFRGWLEESLRNLLSKYYHYFAALGPELLCRQFPNIFFFQTKDCYIEVADTRGRETSLRCRYTSTINPGKSESLVSSDCELSFAVWTKNCIRAQMV